MRFNGGLKSRIKDFFSNRLNSRLAFGFVAVAILFWIFGSLTDEVIVHYPSDVLAGFIAGLIWLATCIAGFEFEKRRFHGTG